MTQAERIISKWPSMAAMARSLGHKNPTTVQGWKDRGYIPARQQPNVLAAAKRDEIPLGPEDFFESEAA